MTTPTAAAAAAAAVAVSVETQIVPGGKLRLKNTATDPNTSIEDAIQTFELLTLELPDSNQHLVEQNLGHPLTTFTCFPKLPLELRLIVWIIEILDTDWFALYLLCRRQLEGNVHQNNFFKFLTGLRTLHVSELKNMSGWERMDYSQDAYEELAKLAEKERREELSAIPFPDIVFHTYRRKQTRSDHDDLHDSAVAYPWN